MPVRVVEVRNRSVLQPLCTAYGFGGAYAVTLTIFRIREYTDIMRKQKLSVPGLWVEQARCREIGDLIFFPPDDKPVARNFYTEAKKVCHKCEVRLQCLDYGLEERYGVWGGTSPVERNILRETAKNALRQRRT